MVRCSVFEFCGSSAIGTVHRRVHLLQERSRDCTILGNLDPTTSLEHAETMCCEVLYTVFDTVARHRQSVALSTLRCFVTPICTFPTVGRYTSPTPYTWRVPSDGLEQLALRAALLVRNHGCRDSLQDPRPTPAETRLGCSARLAPACRTPFILSVLLGCALVLAVRAHERLPCLGDHPPALRALVGVFTSSAPSSRFSVDLLICCSWLGHITFWTSANRH